MCRFEAWRIGGSWTPVVRTIWPGMRSGSPASPWCAQRITLCSGTMKKERYWNWRYSCFWSHYPKRSCFGFEPWVQFALCFATSWWGVWSSLQRGLFSCFRFQRRFGLPDFTSRLGFLGWFLLVACWLVLLLICGSGIGDLDIWVLTCCRDLTHLAWSDDCPNWSLKRILFATRVATGRWLPPLIHRLIKWWPLVDAS